MKQEKSKEFAQFLTWLSTEMKAYADQLTTADLGKENAAPKQKAVKPIKPVQKKQVMAQDKPTKNLRHRRSITSEAYKVLFGSDHIPSYSAKGTMIAPYIKEITTPAGVWLATLNQRGSSCMRYETLRLIVHGCDPDKFKTMSSRAWFKKHEKELGINQTVLKCWYFIRYPNPLIAVQQFLNRSDLKSFGLKRANGGSKNALLVVDEQKFRSALNREYGITCLPGDKNWWRDEFDARKKRNTITSL